MADEAPAGTPGADARPWMAFGVVLLIVFVAAIVLALAQTLT